MTDKQARRLLSKILKKVDYDLWKSYFHKPSFERSEEEVEDDLIELTVLVKYFAD